MFTKEKQDWRHGTSLSKFKAPSLNSMIIDSARLGEYSEDHQLLCPQHSASKHFATTSGISFVNLSALRG